MTKYSQLPRDTMALLSKRALKRVTGQDYVDWAVRALMDGFDSPSLAILAGLDIGCAASQLPIDHFEAHDYFLRVVRELALPIPDIELALSLPDVWAIVPFPYDETALRRHLDELAEQIREGVIDPVIGVQRIDAEVVSPLHYPSDLTNWCRLCEMNVPDQYRVGYSKEEYLEAIVTYATLWVNKVNDETAA
jgi:hypothetical protein